MAVAPAPETETLERFLDRLAGGTPAPAGGAAAALTAAMAAALVGMLARASSRRGAVEPLGSTGGDARRWASIESSADGHRREALRLVGSDIEAYRGVVEARRLRGDERRDELRAALRRATDVPLSLARAAREVLQLCETSAAAVPAPMVSDLAVGVSLAAAALDGAVVTARANLEDLDDADFVALADAELSRLSAESDRLRRRILATLAVEPRGSTGEDGA